MLTTSDDPMNFTGEFSPVKFVYKLPFPWFMYFEAWFCQVYSKKWLHFQNRLGDLRSSSATRPILEVHDFTFLLASFCFVKFTRNEFSGNDSNSIELTAVVLKIDQLNSNWLDLKNPRTYTERKIPWISLFRIILYSYIIRFYRSWHWNKRVCWKQWFSFLGTTTISLLHYKLLRLIT